MRRHFLSLVAVFVSFTAWADVRNFKVTTDQFVGKLSMVRVHQGTLTPGQSLLIGDNKKPVRVAHIQDRKSVG